MKRQHFMQLVASVLTHSRNNELVKLQFVKSFCLSSMTLAYNNNNNKRVT